MSKPSNGPCQSNPACVVAGPFQSHLRHVDDVIGTAAGVRALSTLNMLVLDKGIYFLADTHITQDPSAEELAELAVLASAEMERFGIQPKIAMLSHSNFGSSEHPSAIKVREAVKWLQENTDLAVEGEMHADIALDPDLRETLLPSSKLKGRANLLIMPNLDAANIAYNVGKMLGDGLSVGPMLVGAAMPVHILTTSVTVRGIVNMTALSVVDAQEFHPAGEDS